MTEKHLVQAFIAFLVALAFAAILLVAFQAPVRAQGWPHSEFATQPRKNVVRRPVRREVRKVIVIRPERPADDTTCKRIVTATGSETRIGDPIASAEKAWQAEVAFQHGNMFSDLRNARQRQIRCSSPSARTAVDKAAGLVGADTSRQVCRMEAIPCAAPALEWRDKE
ncbi:hypothetical protein [uncultured Paracoccus sp.]|uniref:hypothetical protein n=1 Tax=uncultured Paracoccus sp. TaxID=189685 RepID=UPI002634CDC7|nr:hypothetical protein [uncultured Paracoccus sp.]